MTDYTEQRNKPIIFFRKDGFIGIVMKRETDMHGNFSFEVIQAGSIRKFMGIFPTKMAIYKIKNINPILVRFVEPEDYSYTPACGYIEANCDIRGNEFTGNDNESQAQLKLSESMSMIQRMQTRIYELEEQLNITENNDKMTEHMTRRATETKAIRKVANPNPLQNSPYGGLGFGQPMGYGGEPPEVPTNDEDE